MRGLMNRICRPPIKKEQHLYKQIFACNLTALWLSILSFPYIFWFYLVSPLAGMFVICLILLYLFTIYINKQKLFTVARVYFFSMISLAIALYASVFGKYIGVQNMFIVVAALSCTIASYHEKKLLFVLPAIPISAFCIIHYFGFTNPFFTIPPSEKYQNILYFTLFINITLILTIVIKHYSKIFEISEETLKKNIQELSQANEKVNTESKKRADIVNKMQEAEKLISLLQIMNEYHHELKSPWNVLFSAVQNDDFKRDELVDIFLDQYKRAEKILSTTIKLLQEKRLNRDEVELDLTHLIEEVLKIFPPRVSRIDKIYAKNLPKLLGDHQDLQILFINIFKNAIRSEEHTSEL